MNFKRTLLSLAPLAALVGALLVPSAAAAQTKAGPQDPAPGAAAAAAAPNQCLVFRQVRATDWFERRTYNVPHTYSAAGYNNVTCGRLGFQVPRGSMALIDLTAAAELDCMGPAGGNGWCEGRFLVNGVPAHPDNTGRGDTFAWDSSNGGTNDWQANTLDQEYAVSCPRSSTTTSPCTYTVQLQVRLVNGATALWLDDLTVRADVHYGATSVFPL